LKYFVRSATPIPTRVVVSHELLARKAFKRLANFPRHRAC
jgi:hypothetical protein